MRTAKPVEPPGAAGVVETTDVLPSMIADASPDVGAASADPELQQRMGVRVGGLQLLVPADAGREVIPPPAISRIPHTAAWLRGLANVRGNLIPVLDLAAVPGINGAGASRRPYLLIAGQGQAAMGLLIDGLPRLVNLSAADRPIAAWQVAPLLQDSVVAAYERDGGVWFEIDLPVLFDTVARHVAF